MQGPRNRLGVTHKEDGHQHADFSYGRQGPQALDQAFSEKSSQHWHGWNWHPDQAWRNIHSPGPWFWWLSAAKRDFTGDAVAETPRSRCREPRFDPWSGNQMPHAATKTQRSQIFWLHWVFIAVCGLSLVAASEGYSLLWWVGFSLWRLLLLQGFPGGLEGKASACNAGDLGSIPESGRSPEEGNGNTLQYSCLENPMNGGAWEAAVLGVAKSRTWLSDFTFLSLSSYCQAQAFRARTQ